MKPVDTHTSERRVFGEADIREMEAASAVESSAPAARVRTRRPARGVTPSPQAGADSQAATPADDTKDTKETQS